MIRRVATLLLLAVPHSTWAENAFSDTQPPLPHQTLHEHSGQDLPPVSIANGIVRANDSVHVASDDNSEGQSFNVVAISHVRAETQNASESDSESPAPTDDARLLRRRAGSSEVDRQQSDALQQEDTSVSFISSDVATTAVAATLFVVGLFLVCAWVFKRGMPKSSRVLPREAVEVLGRCPLGNKQVAHLLHVGNKVVLVNVTASGAETLVEVDDPNEVIRILGVCASSSPKSTSKEFDAIFQQFAKEPAPKGFLGEELTSYSSVASNYSQNSQGDRRG